MSEQKEISINSGGDPSEPQQSSQTEKEMTGGRQRKECLTDNNKSLKRRHSDTTVNLVLLGLAGTGKSASGNTILKQNFFRSRPSSKSITTKCQIKETEINGTCVRLIDTPDIFDDDIQSSDRDKHVTECKQLCRSDPCVYLLVMHVSRFTDGERDILIKLEKAFGSKAKEQTVLLFTRGDDLKRAEMRFEEFLHTCQPGLKEIVERCGERCVVFENSNGPTDQVSALMQKVTEMLETIPAKSAKV